MNKIKLIINEKEMIQAELQIYFLVLHLNSMNREERLILNLMSMYCTTVRQRYLVYRYTKNTKEKQMKSALNCAIFFLIFKFRYEFVNLMD